MLPVEYCAALGTVGDILYVDLGQYLLADKGGIQRLDRPCRCAHRRTGGRRRAMTDARSFGKVAVLMGGSSAEREISLMSGRGVLAALQVRSPVSTFC